MSLFFRWIIYNLHLLEPYSELQAHSEGRANISSSLGKIAPTGAANPVLCFNPPPSYPRMSFAELQTVGAGPSNIEASTPIVVDDSSSTPATEHVLPRSHFYSVEYPGYVKPSSLPIALGRLGGPSQVYAAFQKTGNKPASPLELNLQPKDAFFHPVPGEVVSSNNLLLKVVKRRRKSRIPGKESAGEYTAEIVGSISKTGRFRSRWIYS